MTTQLITSGQGKTINRVACDATVRACRELGLTKDAAQGVLGRGNELSLGIKRLIESLSLDQNLIRIDRSTPFDPVAFIGKGWSIAEQDERSLAMTEVDLNKVTFETTLRAGETSIQGEEKLKRLIASGKIRLDARVFQHLWENQELIPESWKTKSGIFFDGTILRSPDGNRFVLYLYWGDGRWVWHCYWLDSDWLARYPSACLES